MKKHLTIIISLHLAHIQENISVFHFSLTDDEMARIATLDRDEKHDWY